MQTIDCISTDENVVQWLVFGKERGEDLLMIGTGGRVAGALGHLAKDGKLIGPAAKTGDLSPPPTQLEISFFAPPPNLHLLERKQYYKRWTKASWAISKDSTLL